MKLLTLALLAASFFPGCSSPDSPIGESAATAPRTVTSQKLESPPRITSSHDRDALTTTALSLAGLVDLDDPEDTRDSEKARTGFEVHATEMNRNWDGMSEQHLSPLAGWVEAEMGALADSSRALFYPFAGPDFLHAQTFFPHAATYILVGLESPGPIPELDLIEPDDLQVALGRIRRALLNVTSAGYFVTHRMADDLDSTTLGGIQPLLFIFCARTGFSPRSVDFIGLADDGTPFELDGKSEPSEFNAVRIRLTSESAGGDSERTLYYFARDLADAALSVDRAFVEFIRRQEPFHAYFKSASYLLHLEEFGVLRDLLLAGAATIVQDDSGIPYRYLAEGPFDLHLFGTFTRTHPAFGKWFQADLAAAFAARPDARPLPFEIGYQSGLGGGGLIRADRR